MGSFSGPRPYSPFPSSVPFLLQGARLSLVWSGRPSTGSYSYQSSWAGGHLPRCDSASPTTCMTSLGPSWWTGESHPQPLADHQAVTQGWIPFAISQVKLWVFPGLRPGDLAPASSFFCSVSTTSGTLLRLPETWGFSSSLHTSSEGGERDPGVLPSGGWDRVTLARHGSPDECWPCFCSKGQMWLLLFTWALTQWWGLGNASLPFYGSGARKQAKAMAVAFLVAKSAVSLLG